MKSGYNQSGMICGESIPRIIFLTFVTCVMLLPGTGCRQGGEPGTNGQGSTIEGESATQTESIDWSTVTPEDLWNGVFRLYEDDGPGLALALLDRGVDNGIVPWEEADQVRAGFLLELGRFDDAFVALVRFRLDATRPDLLRIRAEVHWGMARYDDARRDYETVLAAEGDNPQTETLFAMSRLYDDLGEWDRSEDIRNELFARSDEDPIAARWGVYDAIQSQDPERIREANSVLARVSEPGEVTDTFSILGEVYLEYFEGNSSEAIRKAREYLAEREFDFNLVTSLLHFDAESGDYAGFESDLRAALEGLNGIRWLEESGSAWPSRVENRQAVAELLDSASALELGRGNRSRAALYAERARDLYPYDFVAPLQLAALEMSENDMAASFLLMNEALDLAPPSNIRTRLRIVQFARLADWGTLVPWDVDALVDELAGILDRWVARYPRNAYYMAAVAEVEGYKGNLEEALGIYEEASALPGATREVHFRRAYFLARLGRIDEAWEVIETHFPPGSPYLIWAGTFEREARAQSDANLALFSTMVRNYMDPDGVHSDFFASPSTSPNE